MYVAIAIREDNATAATSRSEMRRKKVFSYAIDP
jgi:hypothetical protein